MTSLIELLAAQCRFIGRWEMDFKKLYISEHWQFEFEYEGLLFERELEMKVNYRGHCVGTRRVDFFVQSKVMLEIKAVEQLLDVHKAQAINYCEAYNIADGLLINFGGTSLQFKRVYNRRLVNPESLKLDLRKSGTPNQEQKG